MRLPRVRFSVRRMMGAVAVVAAILGLVEERRARFGRIALAHDMEWRKLRVTDLDLCLLLYLSPMDADTLPADGEERRMARPLARFLVYQCQMVNKYQQASCQPWLPVAFDPPPPSKPTEAQWKAYRDFVDKGFPP